MPGDSAEVPHSPGAPPPRRVDQLVFGRYRLEALAGRGGMAEVWRARDEQLNRTVALKFLSVAAIDEEAIRDLKRETNRCLDLNHPNIVRVYDLVLGAEGAAIAMEFIRGQSLAKKKLEQAGGCLAAAELAPWVRQLCEALDYAHRKGKIVHRDLKPSNLLVTDDGELKVADFGISRSIAETQTRVSRTQQQQTTGTLLYMSPQQVAGEEPSPSDDIYALGATLYELLTGKPPFYRGDGFSLLVQIRERTPAPLEEHRQAAGCSGAEIPPSWSETVLACLAKDPALRPPTGEAVWNRLRDFSPRAMPSVAAPPAAAARRPGRETASENDPDKTEFFDPDRTQAITLPSALPAPRTTRAPSPALETGASPSSPPQPDVANPPRALIRTHSPAPTTAPAVISPPPPLPREPGPSFHAPRYRPNWSAALLFFAAGILFLVALLFYDSRQVTFNTTAAPSEKNPLGTTGANTTWLALLSLGIGAWFLPLFLLWMAYVSVRNSKHLTGTRTVAMILAAVALTGFAAMFHPLEWRTDYFPRGMGGWMGATVYHRVLDRVFGTVGSGIAFGGLLLGTLPFVFMRDARLTLEKFVADFGERRSRRAQLRGAQDTRPKK